MKRPRTLVIVAALVTSAGPLAGAQSRPAVPIPERARGAERVVVATVANTTARYERNRFGDELIVTHAELAIEEAIKGDGAPVTLAIEGGTVDDVTLRVSDLPILTRGERAVFFLTPGPNGQFKPHLRGQGILELDRSNQVRGSSLKVDDIRRLVRGNGKQ